MTSADDAVVLAALDAVSNLTVYDGHVTDSDVTTQVVTADLPYVVFYGSPDNPLMGDSLAGTSGAYLTEFQITFVGETREQAKLVGERARAALDRKFLTFASGPRFVRRTDDNQYVVRDDTWTRPGGAPLFTGLDRYAVGI